MYEGLENLILDGPPPDQDGVVDLYAVAESGLVGRQPGQRIGDPANVTDAHRQRWAREAVAIRAERAKCVHVWHESHRGKFGDFMVCGKCAATIRPPARAGFQSDFLAMVS